MSTQPMKLGGGMGNYLMGGKNNNDNNDSGNYSPGSSWSDNGVEISDLDAIDMNGSIMDDAGMGFAKGGIVKGRTNFNYGDNASGVMGESGKEGILPLAQGPDGSMGVTMYGSGEGGSNGGRNTTINMTVYANDVKSFNSSESQMSSILTRMAVRGDRNR
jgi:phage-related minor tail protein